MTKTTATPREAITFGMKLDALLYRYAITCGICGAEIYPGRPIEWDHVHALVHGGPHDFTNLRPVHADCHKRKTAQDVKANAKVKRLLGVTCNGPTKKLQGRGFDKTRTRKFDGQVVPRT